MSAPLPHSVPRSPSELLTRLDRLPRWGLSAASVLTISLGMLFVQYDIFNINVSFVQTCAQIVAGCGATSADQFIGLPVFLSLLGYGIGALVLGPLSDRFGRHRLLILAMVVTGLGSLYSALAVSETHFVISRLITGIGVGADLAIINVYVSEVSPRRRRGRYTSVLFIMAAFGSALGIWLGLWLTTPMGRWPEGLPFALASETFPSGWRWVYGIGVVLAVISLFLRVSLPESPRWLVLHGRVAEADAIIARMERIATRRRPLLPEEPHAPLSPGVELGMSAALRELWRSPLYRRRVLVLSAAWALGYLTIYAFSGAFTSVLVRQGYSPGAAGIVSAVGLLGFIVAAFVVRAVIDQLERKWWMLVGGLVTAVGACIVAFGDGNPLMVFTGAFVLFFGQNVWVPAQYTLTAESFPTRFRTTAYALVDSVGHIGGGLGVFLLVPVLSAFPLQVSMLGLVAFLLAGAAVNLLAPSTRHRRLEEVSP